MKDDKLRKLIEENREAFDVFEPRADLWQDIDKQLHAQKRRSIAFRQVPVWQYAAAITLLLVAGMAVWHLRSHSQAKDPQVTEQTVSLEQLAPEIAEVESYYTSLINQKREELSNYDLPDLGIQDSFSRDIAALDSAYNRLKMELYTTPNKEPIIDAMVTNLQIRMEVLNQQLQSLQRIRRMKLNKTKKHDDSHA